MFWELYQHGRIHDASSTADAARSAARGAESGVRELRIELLETQRQVERLTLTTIALAETLRDKLGVTEEAIEATIRDIDLRDGRLDHKLDQPVQVKRCEACDRVNSPRHDRCIYCGKGLKREPFLFNT